MKIDCRWTIKPNCVVALLVVEVLWWMDVREIDTYKMGVSQYLWQCSTWNTFWLKPLYFYMNKYQKNGITWGWNTTKNKTYLTMLWWREVRQWRLLWSLSPQQRPHRFYGVVWRYSDFNWFIYYLNWYLFSTYVEYACAGWCSISHDWCGFSFFGIYWCETKGLLMGEVASDLRTKYDWSRTVRFCGTICLWRIDGTNGCVSGDCIFKLSV